MFEFLKRKPVYSDADRAAVKTIDMAMIALSGEIKKLRGDIKIKDAVLAANGIKMGEAVDLIGSLNRENTALKAIVTNLRRSTKYVKLYDPTNHSAPTIKVMQVFGSYAVNTVEGPVIYSAPAYIKLYGHYVRLITPDNRSVITKQVNN